MFSLLKKMCFWQKPAEPEAPLTKKPEAIETKREERDDSGYVQFDVGIPISVNGKNSYWLHTFIRGVVLDLREIGEENTSFLVEKNDKKLISGGLRLRGIKVPLYAYYEGPYNMSGGVGAFRALYSEETVSGIVCTSRDMLYEKFEGAVRQDIAKVIVSELYRSSDKGNISFVQIDGNPILKDILAFAKQIGWNIPLTEAREPQKEEPVRDDLDPVLDDLYCGAQKLDAETQEIVRGSVDRIREALRRLQGDDSSSARRRYSVLFNLASVCCGLLHEHLEVAAQGALRAEDTSTLRSIFSGVTQIAEEKRGDLRGRLEVTQRVLGALLAENGVRLG